MEYIPPRSAGKQAGYRKFPTVPLGDEWRHAARRERVRRAATILLDGIAEAGLDREIDPDRRRKFLWYSSGLNRDAIAAHAVGLVVHRTQTTGKLIELRHAERFVWFYLGKHFDWQDVATLKPRGTA